MMNRAGCGAAAVWSTLQSPWTHSHAVRLQHVLLQLTSGGVQEAQQGTRQAHVS